MALDNNIMLLLGAGALNYFLLWRRNSYVAKIIADIFFIMLGMASYLVVEAPVTDWPWGIIIVIIAGIDMLLHIFE